ncbi:MAG: hypothetical protein FWF28_10635, partial [Micrococcales bacterium]|nr:hypothetical protein [Micrococcales bacterium]
MSVTAIAAVTVSEPGVDFCKHGSVTALTVSGDTETVTPATWAGVGVGAVTVIDCGEPGSVTVAP